MSEDKEKAELMAKLARGKGNWGAKYGRLEYFKRFPNLDKSVKELGNTGWILIHKKPNYTGISLNPKHKLNIIDFIEKHLPYFKGMIK
mgnify:FL=1